MVDEHAEGRAAARGRRIARLWSGLRPWQQGAVVLGAGVLAFALLMVLRSPPEIQEPPRPIPIVTTAPARVETGALTVRGSGTVRPSAEITLAPQVSGRVEWVSPALVSGGRFRPGQALLRIEAADYENRVQAAQAEVAGRSVDVLQAEEEVAIAREEWARLEQREALDPERDRPNPLLLREPQLEAARAALRRAEAVLEDARLALERTSVRAPFDGIVRSESVDRGQFVTPGQPLAQVYATEAIEVVVPLSDDEAALIPELWSARAGGAGARIPAVVHAEYGGGRFRWEGFVDRAESALDERTRTVDVVVRVPSPFDVRDDGQDRPPLLLGTFVTVDIQGVELDSYVVVPAAAVRDGPVVWTVVRDTLLVVRSVEVLQEVEDEAHLRAELAAGTPVIVSPLPVVTDGMTVRVAEPLETAPATDGDGS